MKVVPDTQAAVQFLQSWKAAPWVLTAINPEGGPTKTATLHSPADAEAWINSRQGVNNLYFQVNQTGDNVTRKTSKEDITALYALHVDIDPRAGEEVEAEKARALAALATFSPQPTVILDSGNGIQAFWKLADPVQHNSDNTADLEAYNRMIAEKLGGDNCHNIDRIMRLPGTVNLPNPQKVKKGRVPALSKVISATWETYPLFKFTPAADLAPAAPKTTSALPNELPMVDVEQLPVSDRCKAIILYGHDPNDPDSLPSRSEWLFSVCCQMARAGCDKPTIVAVIMDPANDISQSVRDKRHNALSYAERQAEKALAVAVEPTELQEMNDKHFIVKLYGGKFRVAFKRSSPDKDNLRYTFVSRNDFIDAYEARKIKVGQTKQGEPIMMSLGKWWLSHPLRREYEEVVFKPEQEVEETQFNLWEGFAVDPEPGALCTSYLNHLRDNICNSDPEAYSYLVRWLARTVQFPAQPGEVAVVVTGDKGTGKGQFANHFGKLFGIHYKTITNPRHLVGNFNGHLENCLVLFADEATPTENAKQGGILKGLITEPKMLIERKSVNAQLMDNFVHIIMASNEWHAVHFTPDERRYLVLRTGNTQRGNRQYFAQIAEDLQAGGYAHLLHYLQNIDLTEWDHTRIPVTQAAKDQLVASIGKTTAFLMEVATKGVLPGHSVQKRGRAELMCLSTTASLLGVHPTSLRSEWISKGYIISRDAYQHATYVSHTGDVLPGKTESGGTTMPRLMYEMLPLSELRDRLKSYAPYGWPNDGDIWRLEEDEANAPF